MSLQAVRFPCLTPGNAHAILNKGIRSVASGPARLAVQGIGAVESEQCGDLYQHDGTPLQDMAGNAFTASMRCAFLLAALSTI